MFVRSTISIHLLLRRPKWSDNEWDDLLTCTRACFVNYSNQKLLSELTLQHTVFDMTIVSPVMKYVCQAWYSGLSKGQVDGLEAVQKRTMCFIFPDINYSNAMFIAGLTHSRSVTKTKDLPIRLLQTFSPIQIFSDTIFQLDFCKIYFFSIFFLLFYGENVTLLRAYSHLRLICLPT